MRTLTLIRRNLTWYWRTNLSVVLGVATAVAVLAGALLVGHSVRASLRDLFLERLGKTDYVVSRNGFFRGDLAAAFPKACPLISLQAVVAADASGRRASGIQVYAVDQRFAGFQGVSGTGPQGRDILLSPAVAQELAAKPGDSILVRVAKPSDIPLESLHGRREELARAMRFTVRQAQAFPAEFSWIPQQGDPRAVFVPLERLQKDLKQESKVNTILVAGGAPEKLLRERYTLEDLGIKLRALEAQHCLSVETDSTLVSDSLADAAARVAGELGMRAAPILTYLANTIRAGAREVSYSLVTAMQIDEGRPDAIVLNHWAARDLGAKPGDRVTLEYYVWKNEGRLATESAQFEVSRVVPIEGFAADRDLAPEYPGITEPESLHDWDPPFPIDLRRVRPADEEYWKKYRTTPKAFVPLARGQQLWQSRFGKLTSIRVFPPAGTSLSTALDLYRNRLRAALDPAAMGLTVFAAREHGLAGARGSTDFGEYFVYFSFFLMASALLLTGLFFRLGVEQRLREIGILRSLGFPIARLRTVFLTEGLALAAIGAAVGVAGALGYSALVLLGLRTWWIGAVGTTRLSLHVGLQALAVGAAAGMATALGCIAWTLRGLRPVTPRGLLAGSLEPSRARKPVVVAAALAGLLAVGCVAGGATKRLDLAAAFFGAGTLLLVAFLSVEWLWLHSRLAATTRGLWSLGFRSATYRPGRSVLSIALIACAAFLIISVGAFRRDSESSGSGGFPLMAESILPLFRENIPSVAGVSFVPFRLKPGEDVSCLNLYQPQNPKILGAPEAFLHMGRFRFQDSLGKTAEQKRNPWMLLESSAADDVIPAIADANSMTYVLHRKLGEEFIVGDKRFRIVGALEDSVFQGELLVSERSFLRLFPDEPGFRFFLIDVLSQRAGDVTRELEESLSDYGFDAVATRDRLAAFHRVENTYLSTFQALGALGLLLGTAGLSAVLLRNVLERRRELALLQAVGFRRADLVTIVISENALLLMTGLATGLVCAVLAIAPAFLSRGGPLPTTWLAMLAIAVLGTGLAASFVATVLALRSPLLAALRSE